MVKVDSGTYVSRTNGFGFFLKWLGCVYAIWQLNLMVDPVKLQKRLVIPSPCVLRVQARPRESSLLTNLFD